MKEIFEHIEDMLAYKESLGYSRRTYEGFLKDFAAYLNNYYSGAIKLSEDMALGV